MRINFREIYSSVIIKGNERFAFRDPTAYYLNGIFYCFFSMVENCDDGLQYFYIGLSKSEDLVNWTKPVRLTVKDRSKNYSSPGNIFIYNNKYYMSLQTYCTEGNPVGKVTGNKYSRVYLMNSDDLECWSEPEILMVKGDIPIAEMGRMIDPYVICDKDEPNKWWCFYKQPMDSVSFSYSYDLKNWTYAGTQKCGENVCVIVKDDEYWIYNSPENGIGLLKTKDLINFEEGDLITLGQDKWDWCKDRITAGFVLDLKSEKNVGKYLMFFCGGDTNPYPFSAHTAIAWSDDLKKWNYK